MMLRVLSGPQAGAELALGDEPRLVGSDEHGCDIVLFGCGVAPAHCTLRSVDGRGLMLQTSDGAITEINGQALAPGEHLVQVPAHLKLAGADLLLHRAELPAANDGEDGRRGRAAPQASRRRRAMRWATSAACVGGFTVFVSGAMGWFDETRPSELTLAQRMAADLGYRDLVVAYDVEGLLTVTGYVRDPREAEQVRKAFQAFPGKAVSVRVAVPGAATQIDRGMRSVAEPQRLGAGGLLIESQAPAAASAAKVAGAGQDMLELKVRTLRAGDGGYLETTAGMRYFIGSLLPGGYTLKAVGEASIVLLRGEIETEVPVRR
jgi:hypothetical protein